MKFLVVDDDAEYCAALRELLEESGYIVEFEPDADRAQQRAGSFDLLILDVMRPDGFVF